MESDKVAFLFGTLPAWADPDDPDERTELMSREVDEDAPGALIQLAIRTAVANQIADDDPPQVWATAQRLLGEGLDRHDVLRQLVLTFTPQLVSALHEREPFDREDYLSALARLPLPSAGDCERTLLEVARSRPSIPVAELDELVAARLGLPVDDATFRLLLDRVSEDMMDPDGPLELLAGDRVVHVEALTDGIVLTHRLTESERATGVLPVDADLSGFRRHRTLNLPDGEAITVTAESWTGPPGWLADVPANSLLAIRIDGSVLSLTALQVARAVDPELVALLRAGYDEAVAEPWLPVPVEELVLHARLHEPTAFATPAAALAQLLDAAGLEVRGTEVAHEESVWQNLDQVRRTSRLLNRLGPGELTGTVVNVLELLDKISHGLADTGSAQDVLDDLYDPAVLEVVADELLGLDDDPERLRTTGALAQRLLAAASRPAQRAVAHWLTAVVAEREGRVVAAETELRAAVRLDPDWGCAADRLAWYCSDRGDAEAALTLWRGIGATSANSEDVRLLESFAASSGRPRLGRNERCWCGSGRKFKQCHLGQVALPPLPERVGWLCRKATAYLERRGGSPQEVIYEHTYVRALDPDDEDSVLEALEDPLVLDVVLHEGGWFDRFLADRGALLPEDESCSPVRGRWWTARSMSCSRCERRRREGARPPYR
ncbi:MAG: SEC-C domain-containing protein [Actinobacteria bacterium]|nr:SEC-C domain-containing protein [Actinomycetota bacterium]MBW3648647.1 SEC-C domain-containing protein [Actinomycetota bacterium]